MSLDIYLVCPHCETTVTSQNITHNVSPMWVKAGCFDALYESNGKLASWSLPALEAAIIAMKADPDGFRALNPANGWGSYEGALEWLEKWTKNVREKPELKIVVSR